MRYAPFARRKGQSTSETIERLETCWSNPVMRVCDLSRCANHRNGPKGFGY